MKIEKNNKTKKYIKIIKKDAKEVIDILMNSYPDAKCSLNYTTPLSLTVSLILAAQCTDERVNKISPLLFKKFPSVYDIANANVQDISNIIKPCGFYKTKANNIKKMANTVITIFDGNIPNTMDDLIKLNGIGRKSANIILQECFNKTVGIAVDTHVTRISRKIGFSNGKTQEEIEKDLMKKFDKKYWNKINHVLVYHGRQICIARRPKCDICMIKEKCKRND